MTFGTLQSLGLDSAGNLYIGDGIPNNVIRVINTQATAQTFFGVTVQPGYIASIVNCGSLTVACPANAGNMPETVANTGIGGPAGAAVFNTLATGEGNWMSTDAYGNIYELNYKGATPAINLGVAYAGGTALGKLINNANAGAGAVVGGTISGAAQLPSATPGDFYYLLADITLRPSSVTADPYGNVYYEDNHNGQIYRIDANATAWNTDFVEVSFLTSSGNSLTNIPNRVTFGQSSTSAGTLPAFCYPVSGQSISKPIVAGYITPDDWGSGCPAIVAMGTGVSRIWGRVMEPLWRMGRETYILRTAPTTRSAASRSTISSPQRPLASSGTRRLLLGSRDCKPTSISRICRSRRLPDLVELSPLPSRLLREVQTSRSTQSKRSIQPQQRPGCRVGPDQHIHILCLWHREQSSFPRARM